MAKKAFILSDENVNEYGFRMLMSGARLDKFKNNPVMLFNHRDHGDDYEGPIGKWENIRIEGGQLMADSAFDEDDEKAKRLSGKVDRGFLKGASLGFNIISVSSDPMLLKEGQTLPTVTEWEPFEASVVDIPGNANCLMLRYNGESVLVKQPSDLTKLSIFQNKPQIETDMDKFPKDLTAELGLSETATAAEVNDAVKKLKKDLKDVNDAAVTARENEIKGIVSEAKLKKGFDDAQELSFLKLGKNDIELLRQTLKVMPDKKTLKSQVEGGGKEEDNDERKAWTIRDWEKKDAKGLLKLKAENKEKYEALFAATYGKK